MHNEYPSTIHQYMPKLKENVENVENVRIQSNAI